MMNEIREDMLKVKRMIADVEIILGKREGETELVNKLIDAENLLTYCMSRLENAIVPPCKVGDKVYVDGNSWSEYACIHYENEFIYSKFFVIGKIVSIVKTKKQLLMKIRVESANHSRYYHKRYTVNAIGKTVFFTKEEAKKALKEGADNG